MCGGSEVAGIVDEQPVIICIKLCESSLGTVSIRNTGLINPKVTHRVQEKPNKALVNPGQYVDTYLFIGELQAFRHKCRAARHLTES